MSPNARTPTPPSVAVNLIVLAYMPPRADESIANEGSASDSAPVADVDQESLDVFSVAVPLCAKTSIALPLTPL